MEERAVTSESINVSRVLELAREGAKYDFKVKEVLSDKQILARILKHAVEDFAEEDIETIIAGLGESQVGNVPVEAGHTNLGKVERTTEADLVPGEGAIYFDIRFKAHLGRERLRFLMNVEAQKSTSSAKLGYQLDNRMIYYTGRMISSQKEVEFHNLEYDGLKPVRSIWICMDAAREEDSINRIYFTEEASFGSKLNLPNLDKVQIIVIRLRNSKRAEKSKNELIAMLEEILSNKPVEEKKKNLEEYGIKMSIESERRLEEMCNLSELLIEEGIERGIERGIEQGIEQGIERGSDAAKTSDIISIMSKLKYTAEQAMELLNIPVENREHYRSLLKMR